jgi:hypothetical protein
MPNGLTNQPRLTRGALVDIDLTVVPPLFVPFQFNPETVQRRRSVSVRDTAALQGHAQTAPPGQTLGESQSTTTDAETISFDIRLDATERLGEGDPLTGRFGVLPELSALEMMSTPRASTPFAAQLGLSGDFGFGGRETTPVVVFVWGRFRVYPVRLTELSINETEYDPALNPTRVIASVTLQVLEGGNVYSRFTTARRVAALTSLVSGRTSIRSLINLG